MRRRNRFIPNSIALLNSKQNVQDWFASSELSSDTETANEYSNKTSNRRIRGVPYYNDASSSSSLSSDIEDYGEEQDYSTQEQQLENNNETLNDVSVCHDNNFSFRKSYSAIDLSLSDIPEESSIVSNESQLKNESLEPLQDLLFGDSILVPNTSANANASNDLENNKNLQVPSADDTVNQYFSDSHDSVVSPNIMDNSYSYYDRSNTTILSTTKSIRSSVPSKGRSSSIRSDRDYSTASISRPSMISKSSSKNSFSDSQHPSAIISNTNDEDEFALNFSKESKKKKQSSYSDLELKIYQKGGLKQIENDDGTIVKRSNRVKYKPLEYWRNERVKFGRRKSGPFPVPVIQEIIRVPEQEDSNSKKSRRKVSKDGFEIEMDPTITIINPTTQETEEQDLLYPPIEPKYKQSKNGNFKLAKLLSDPFNSNLCAGLMSFPKASEKPLRNSGNITSICFVICGEVEVTINETTFLMNRGGCFLIPKGNDFKIENTRSREARLFFVNDRKEAE